MRNFIIVVLMFLLPSLAMAQGQVTRKPVSPSHKHSVNGPKNCKDCNRIRVEERRKEQERIAAQQRLEEQRHQEEERRLAEERKRKAEEEARLAGLDPILQRLVNNMVYVEGGTFTMGATSEQGRVAESNEKPTHRVTLFSYYIGRYEVTQAEWKAVMGSNPSNFNGDNLPVENVSWDYCQEFIRKLNSLTGKNFRLPTEAEWEFAARGGNNSQGYKYSGSNDVGSVAWYEDNSGNKTHPVGLKSPNELGLYDMSGNVREWCQDCYGKYSSSSRTNPTGSSSISERVVRGGGYSSFRASFCRVSGRGYYTPNDRLINLGLRLAEGRQRTEQERLAEERDRKTAEEEELAEKKRIIDNLINNMVYVEGGTFTMGATSDQGRIADKDEKPAHPVTLSSYYIGKYEVTQAEWTAVMGSNPSKFWSYGDNFPVESVSWDDCQEFILKLNSFTGKNFRLPTEAEWEFAARGGNYSHGYVYPGSNRGGSVARYDLNSDDPYPVGLMPPNELGIYNMAGNVSEWCQDWYGKYSSSSQTNPTGPVSGSNRVIRGGSYYDPLSSCRVSCRIYHRPNGRCINVGLRLAM